MSCLCGNCSAEIERCKVGRADATRDSGGNARCTQRADLPLNVAKESVTAGGVSERSVICGKDAWSCEMESREMGGKEESGGGGAKGSRRVDGGAWMEEHGWRSMDGGAWMEEHGWRSMDGGAWMEEHGWRSMDGGAWMEEHGWRSMDGGAWMEEHGWRSMDGGAWMEEHGWRSMDGGAWMEEHGWRSMDGGAREEVQGEESRMDGMGVKLQRFLRRLKKHLYALGWMRVKLQQERL
ncbi:unnamed protein product [Closterium sp. NIES-64]|nr:unnamed protein product [Closterium sp. NIES-64]